jgi:hypothetical protein
MSKYKTLSLKYKRKARAKELARAISMQKFLSEILNALKTKGKRAKTAPKVEQKRVFVRGNQFLFQHCYIRKYRNPYRQFNSYRSQP